MPRRISALLALLALSAPAAQAAPLATYRVSLPTFVDPSVGHLFPDAQRLGAAAEFPLQGDWSLSVEGYFLHKNWSTTDYSLALTPVLLRHRTAMSLDSALVKPFLSLGAGGAAMTLLGGPAGIQMGFGPAGSLGIGLELTRNTSVMLEAQGGLVNSIRYFGLGLGLGMSFDGAPPSRMITSRSPAPTPRPEPAAPEPARPVQVAERPAPEPTPEPVPVAIPAEKPPLPQGRLMRVGQIQGTRGNLAHLILDELPYRVQPGDVLVVYYGSKVPIKVAKIRILALDASGRTARAQVIATTEAIRRGYLVGTL